MANHSLSRRGFLLAAAPVIGVGAVAGAASVRGLVAARDLVRGGALGKIVFCRTLGNGEASLGALDFLLDPGEPVSVTDHGAGRRTLRYAGFLASHEFARQESLVICGSRATLAVNPAGWRLFEAEA
jgi:hypothetical protein